MKDAVYSIGHSNLTYERFLSLLRQAGVTAVADVRSAPYSRHSPQFNKDTLKEELRRDQVKYSFLGNELGGRPKASQFYCDGIADYERMAQAPEFKIGIERVLEGARKYRVALMCSEHDPLDCHRCLLVGRALVERGARVEHIQSDGQIESHDKIERRLLQLAGGQDADLFIPYDDQLAEAYRNRARKVAFQLPLNEPANSLAAE